MDRSDLNRVFSDERGVCAAKCLLTAQSTATATSLSSPCHPRGRLGQSVIPRHSQVEVKSRDADTERNGSVLKSDRTVMGILGKASCLANRSRSLLGQDTSP